MEPIKNSRQKIQPVEKIILALTLLFLLFTIGYFFDWFSAAYCPLCRQHLQPNQDYFWDVRTGLALKISDYLEGEQDWCWYDDLELPQEVSATNQCGYARFPDFVTHTVRYCSKHRNLAVGTQDFYILSVQEGYTICYAIPDGRTVTPDDHTVLKQFNNELNCWELVILWQAGGAGA